MANTLKVGYIEVSDIVPGLPRLKFEQPQEMGTGEGHAYLQGKALSLCGKPILDATDQDWPGTGLGSPWCQACLDNTTPQPTPM